MKRSRERRTNNEPDAYDDFTMMIGLSVSNAARSMPDFQTQFGEIEVIFDTQIGKNGYRFNKLR